MKEEMIVSQLIGKTDYLWKNEQKEWIQCPGEQGTLVPVSKSNVYKCARSWASQVNQMNCQGIWQGTNSDLSRTYFATQSRMHFPDKMLSMAAFRLKEMLEVLFA
jgi:hypothetical protein